ncbi:MAG: RES domain-containing protein [Xenococcaceae cyanobacterium MO_188.B19]|nr:RES domain-containing protein [Xenococcaceae cyanobacterium MO_188.B19]
MVAIDSPPPNPQITISPVYEILKIGTELRRIYNPTKYNTQATTFRHYGPINRFDHHQYPLDNPGSDPDRGINYWGFTLSCCLVEVFGDTRIIDTTNLKVALIQLTKPIKLLDLRGSAAMKVGTVSAISKTANRDLSQAWGSYFYDNPQTFSQIEGLLFSNAHNDEDAIALYERAKPQLGSSKIKTLPLNSVGLRSAIEDAAIKNNLICNFN